jgi:hypothetical protein
VVGTALEIEPVDRHNAEDSRLLAMQVRWGLGDALDLRRAGWVSRLGRRSGTVVDYVERHSTPYKHRSHA